MLVFYFTIVTNVKLLMGNLFLKSHILIKHYPLDYPTAKVFSFKISNAWIDSSSFNLNTFFLDSKLWHCIVASYEVDKILVVFGIFFILLTTNEWDFISYKQFFSSISQILIVLSSDAVAINLSDRISM